MSAADNVASYSIAIAHGELESGDQAFLVEEASVKAIRRLFASFRHHEKEPAVASLQLQVRSEPADSPVPLVVTAAMEVAP